MDQSSIPSTRANGKKAKYIIRNSADFFDRYDNKYWALSRQVCFWASTLSIIASIIGAVVLILLMPKTCDPQVQWWQGKLTLDIVPRNGTEGTPSVDIVKLIFNIPKYKRIGVQTLKMKQLYLKTPDSDLNPSDPNSWLAPDSEEAMSRVSQPWINWALQGKEGNQLNNAELAFLMFLPGTVSLGEMHSNEDLVERLAKIRAAAVPVFMNGNYKTCHGHCTNFAEKEVNHVVHVLDDNLLLLERSFSRRNRYMVVANVGSTNSSLHAVSKIYAGGELILDTNSPGTENQYVDFKDAELSGMQAYVIKFPK